MFAAASCMGMPFTCLKVALLWLAGGAGAMLQGARTEPGGHASAPTGAAERERRLQAQEAASQTQVAAHLGEVAESTLGQNRDPLGGGTLEAGSVAEPSEARLPPPTSPQLQPPPHAENAFCGPNSVPRVLGCDRLSSRLLGSVRVDNLPGHDEPVAQARESTGSFVLEAVRAHPGPPVGCAGCAVQPRRGTIRRGASTWVSQYVYELERVEGRLGTFRKPLATPRKRRQGCCRRRWAGGLVDLRQ